MFDLRREWVRVLLSRQFLAGVVEGPLTGIASAMGLRIERSFNDARVGCTFTYFETDHDIFTLVNWDPSDNVEIYAHVDPTYREGVDFTARPELQ